LPRGYDYGTLKPAMSEQMLELHHSKHHGAYVKDSSDTFDQLAEARDKSDYTALVALEKTVAFNLSAHVRTRPSGATCPRTAATARR
jgi:Fe-Mn family superoxide dismutase